MFAQQALVFTEDPVLSASFDPKQLWGIAVALIGATLMSFGAQYQSRGLNKVERLTGVSARSGLSIRHVLGLLRRPSWVTGTSLFVLAILFQLAALTLAPLIVVQPLGVTAVVITTVLNLRMTGVRLPKRALLALSMCVCGIVTFVAVAAFSSADQPVTHRKLVTILLLFAGTLLVVFTAFFLLRRRMIALVYILGAGVLYGFVVTLAKTVIARIMQDQLDWLAALCVIALLLGAIAGMVFVQNAYSSGPPDLVIAGLTVIDPLVAVLIGILVLHEAAAAPVWAVICFVITGCVALSGVFVLAKFHPQVGRNVVAETVSIAR